MLIKDDLNLLVRLSREIEAWKSGFNLAIGVDEAGRGSLAGPVVAGAVAVLGSRMPDDDFYQLAAGVDDSKRISPGKRIRLYGKLMAHPAILRGVGMANVGVIDHINILQASKLAMKRAILNLRKSNNAGFPERDIFCLVDGNSRIDEDYDQETIIGGDQKIFSISAASIIAKVTRDRMMENMDKKFPGYGFCRNKGYGTAVHLAALERLGPCLIHRKTFSPVNLFIRG